MFFVVKKVTAHFQHLCLAEDHEIVLEQCKNKNLLHIKSSVHSAYYPRPHLIMYILQVSLKKERVGYPNSGLVTYIATHWNSKGSVAL